jgi:putative phosphoribosyl transferase
MVGGRTSNTRVIPKVEERAVSVEMGPVTLEGDLALPDQAAGIVLFAHGSGSGRYSPRNRAVAQALQQDGLGTLLIDLLTEEEEEIDLETRHLRFDIPMLAERLAGAIDWLGDHESTRNLPIGLFGASTGAGAALIAAVNRPDQVRSVVSRGGRPDLAEEALPRVTAPTLLIVGGLDEVVIGLNQLAYHQLKCEKRLEIIPGATHLFEEPGALEQVSTLARAWFMRGFGTRGD